MSDKDQEKKKVIFKLSFANQKDLPSKEVAPQMITEWNYTRIAIALFILLVLIVAGISIALKEDMPVAADNNTQETQTNEVATNRSQLPDIATDPVVLDATKQADIINLPNEKQTSIKAPSQIAGSVVRAQLAKGIWKDEPFGKITGTVRVTSEEATGIYYFTELENMQGKAVFHIWKYKGDVIFKKKKDILENPWKTFTSKLFTRRSIGPWSVETVDSNNRQLNVINFNVVSATD